MAEFDGISNSTGLDENRIKTNGQVFTPDSIVNDMLDDTDKKIIEALGDSDEVYIEHTVLEPTCGNGNFVIRILDRKLERVARMSEEIREVELLKAVSSIYGIELMPDNVMCTKLRMMEVIEKGSTPVFELEYKTPAPFRTTGFNLRDDIKKCIKLILDRNIQCGDSLKGEKYLTHVKNVEDVWSVKAEQLANPNFAVNFAYNIAGKETDASELVLTQYEFENGYVAIRERAFSNMTESNAVYRNTTGAVNYDKLYTLPESQVYVIQKNTYEEEEEVDF